MKALLLALLFGLCFSQWASGQSIFYMQYRFKGIEDTTLYHVFLVHNDDGTGFYRVRFYDDETKDDMVVELDMKEMYFVSKGVTDSTKLYFKGSNPRVIYGDKTYKYYPERFWFKLDPNTDTFEPWAVTSPDEEKTVTGRFTEKPVLLESADLTPDFIAEFFNEKDQFYQTMVVGTPRHLSKPKPTKLHLVIV